MASQPNRTAAFDSSLAKPLLIIGASSRAAAQSARRAGFFVAAADLFADLDLISDFPLRLITDYPNGFGEVVQTFPADGWLYTGGLENYPDLIDAWSQYCPLWGNKAEVLRAVRNPGNVAECLSRAGLLCPAVFVELDHFSQVPADGGWLLKPLKSAAGEGISLWRGTLPPKGNFYLQEYIHGKSTSAVFVAMDGQTRLLGITRQLLETTGNDVTTRYAGSIGPLNLPVEQFNQFAAIGQTLAREFGLVGVFGVDAVVNEAGGVWPIEVNPRYPASAEVLERATGVSMIGCHVAAFNAAHPSLARRANTATGESMPTGEPEADHLSAVPAPGVHGKAPIHGKQIVYADTAITITRDLREVEPQVADIPAIGTHIPAGAPIATVLAEGTSVREVEALLAERVGRLHAT